MMYLQMKMEKNGMEHGQRKINMWSLHEDYRKACNVGKMVPWQDTSSTVRLKQDDAIYSKMVYIIWGWGLLQ